MIRQFYLVNGIGSTYFFDYRNQTLISNVGDLGFSKQNTFLSFDDEFVLVESKNPQGSLAFEIVFLKGYAGYKEFISFLRKSTDSLRLFYKCDNTLKYCYVTIKSISKSELKSNTIQSSLTLDRLSLWLVKETYEIKVAEDKTGKIFPFIYPFNYSVSYKGIISINNDGDSKAPLNILINGAVNNPIVEILKDNEVISMMRLKVLSDNCIIEINSASSNQFMNITEGGITKSIYQLQDFTCDNFLFIEKGIYQVRFTPGVTGDTICKITLLKGYVGQ